MPKSKSEHIQSVNLGRLARCSLLVALEPNGIVQHRVSPLLDDAVGICGAGTFQFEHRRELQLEAQF
jgi:hypothetical protein